MPSVFTVASKEFSDIIKSKRFLILVTIFVLLVIVAQGTVYVSVSSSTQRALPRGFLGSIAYSLVTIMSYFAPIVGLALGFDVISGEREKGTLKIVLAQPIYRDMVFNGKFIAAFLSVSLAVLVSSVVNVGIAIVALGISPPPEDVVRLIIFMIFSILFAMTYYAISAFLSTATRRSSQSIIVGVILWAVFVFIIPVIASLVASALVPVSFTPQNITRSNATTFRPPEMQQYTSQMAARAQISSLINSFTPNYHFTSIAHYVLGVYAGAGTIAGGRIPTAPSSSASTSLVMNLFSAWPNILVLTTLTIVLFIASYTLFIRQEIR
ncbi:MAG: ABC transporter permease subunit [Nitrososphaeria archaeon]